MTHTKKGGDSAPSPLPTAVDAAAAMCSTTPLTGSTATNKKSPKKRDPILPGEISESRWRNRFGGDPNER